MKEALLFVLHHQDKFWVGNFSILVHIKLLNRFLGFLHLKESLSIQHQVPDVVPHLVSLELRGDHRHHLV